ncbi:hypothetical protein [Nocardia sp. N2S4-5]|uniref:hypothetical protein n=1 Tax=Nocardia sp. N2S4-5 TaxID=3351565 RepID=UPI0037D7E71B
MTDVVDVAGAPRVVESRVVGDYLVAATERLGLGSDAATVRAVAASACGARLHPVWPDGRRATTLTLSGFPLEVSVTGGRGEVVPALRYVTETATEQTEFARRAAVQLATIPDLVARLPEADSTVAELLRSFVATVYPDPAAVSRRHRFVTWAGITHRAALPRHAAYLKVYANLRVVPGAVDRLCRAWPEFAGSVSVPEGRKFVGPVAAALEVDAGGDLTHKIYLSTRYNDPAVPEELVRYLGDPIAEMLAEFARCGAEANPVRQYNLALCRAHRHGKSSVTLYLLGKRHTDVTELARALAARHHGSTDAVDALAQAAETAGAVWRYSGVGLGFSPDSGIDKLNVYGTPLWITASAAPARGER